MRLISLALMFAVLACADKANSPAGHDAAPAARAPEKKPPPETKTLTPKPVDPRTLGRGLAAPPKKHNSKLVAEAARRSAKSVHRCIKSAPDLTGRLLATFTILENGKADGIELDGVGDRKVHDCVREAISSTQFSNAQTPTTVKLPITFRPKRNRVTP